MKMIKNIIEYLIAISVIPAIILTVVSVTELKDVKNVQYELLSEEEGIFHVTQGTYDRLVDNKKIKNYDIESNYPLITREEMDRATWEIEDVKNEIYIDENGEKRFIERIGQVTFDGSENWLVLADGSASIVFVLWNGSINTDRNLLQKGSYLDQVDGYRPDEDYDGFSIRRNGVIIQLSKSRGILTTSDLKQYLAQNPLTIYFELAVKNPKSQIIESNDLYITSDYVSMVKPNDFSNNPDGLLISDVMNYIDRFEVTTDYINIFPKDITTNELGNRLVGKSLTYELVQPRLVEVYDFSKFRLVYDKNRIRVIFDIDDGYYLWEITNDDKLIPINGQYDIGGIWTVKYYVYEIQQPLIRSLVLLIPLIVISGLLLYMYNMLKKKGISY